MNKTTPKEMLEIRLRLDLTQQQFADKLGFSKRQHISKLERGERRITKRLEIQLEQIRRELGKNS